MRYVIQRNDVLGYRLHDVAVQWGASKQPPSSQVCLPSRRVARWYQLVLLQIHQITSLTSFEVAWWPKNTSLFTENWLRWYLIWISYFHKNTKDKRFGTWWHLLHFLCISGYLWPRNHGCRIIAAVPDNVGKLASPRSSWCEVLAWMTTVKTCEKTWKLPEIVMIPSMFLICLLLVNCAVYCWFLIPIYIYICIPNAEIGKGYIDPHLQPSHNETAAIAVNHGGHGSYSYRWSYRHLCLSNPFFLWVWSWLVVWNIFCFSIYWE